MKFEAEYKDRIDKYLIDVLNMSRSKIQKLIKDEKILVNENVVKNNYILNEEDVIEILSTELEQKNIEGENIPLDIVYEDDYILVINKKNGMVVHPAPGHHSGTLVNGLINYSDKLSKINGEFRPGILHRIDAYTTGLLIVCKDDEAHSILAEELKSRKVNRYYLALVWGEIAEERGLIDAPIGRDRLNRKKMAVTKENSKKAVTNFKVIERYKNVTLIECKLDTGRTHQIRVHMNYINHPIVNEPVYSNKKIIDDSGQLLHAYKLEFLHPMTKEFLSFEVELPEEFNKIFSNLKD